MAANPNFDRVVPSTIAGNLFTRSGPIPPEENVYGAQHGWIVSVHYNPIEVENVYVNLRLTVAGVTRADLEKNIVRIVEIPDCVEMVTIGDLVSPKIHRGIDLARAFVSDQLSSMLGVNMNVKDDNGRPMPMAPGIGVSTTATPSKALLQKLIGDQERFDTRMVQEADVYHQRGEQNRITDDHRKAADHLNLDTEWKPKPKSMADSKKCIGCAEDIKYAAQNCRFCGAPQAALLYERWMEAKIPAPPPVVSGQTTMPAVPTK